MCNDVTFAGKFLEIGLGTALGAIAGRDDLMHRLVVHGQALHSTAMLGTSERPKSCSRAADLGARQSNDILDELLTRLRVIAQTAAQHIDFRKKDHVRPRQLLQLRRIGGEINMIS